MPREKEAYRDNLERILERFGGKEVLSMQDAMEYTGLGRDAILSSGMPIKQTSKARGLHGGLYFISSATLARWLS